MAWFENYESCVSDTSEFDLSYITLPSAECSSLITEIFVSERHYYPRGLQINIQPSDVATATHQPGTNVIIVTHNASRLGPRTTVTITVKAK